MSATESDSDNSYQSDDSEYNIIPGYAMINDVECENQAANSDAGHETSSDDDKDSVCGIAYADEPLADEEWLNKYHKEENERLEAEEKFLRRFDGSLEISEW